MRQCCMVRRRSAVLAVVLACTVMVAACGQSDTRFVANKRLGVFLKVPAGWTELSQQDLRPLYTVDGKEPSGDALAQLESISWEKAWDSSPNPGIGHFVLGEANAPVVRTYARTLLPKEHDKVSLDSLRDVVVGSYSQSYADYLDIVRQPGTASFVNADFEPLQDTELTPKGFFGVRTIFKVRTTDGGLYDLAQVALVDQARTHLYLLLVHCSDACFLQNQAPILDVVNSFTVKEPL